MNKENEMKEEKKWERIAEYLRKNNILCGYENELPTDANSLNQFLMNFLCEEGYVPKLDDDGNVLFKFEGRKYSIIIDEDDIMFLRIYCAYGWECENDEERTKMFEAASETNKILKLAKTYIVNDEAFVVAIETLLGSQEHFKVNFKRWLTVLKSAANTFVEKMTMEEDF